MKIKRKTFIISFLLSITVFATGFITPVIHTQAKETLTFSDEIEISEHIKNNISYVGKSLRTVGYPWSYDSTHKSVHLQDGIFSPSPSDPSHKFLDFNFVGSHNEVSKGTKFIETDYNWNINTHVGTGQHLYNYEMKEGDIMPVSKWECFGNPTAIHHVSYLPNIATHVTGDWYNYDGVICKNHTSGGTACPIRDGRWYETANYILQPDGTYGFSEITASEQYMRNGNSLSTTLYDYPTYRCKCAICDEWLSSVFFECPEEHLNKIKYIEIGTHVITKCRGCGALENEGYTTHSCKAISDNRYYITYDDGTKDPNVYGTQSDTVLYANNTEKYEGASVFNPHTLAKCKFIRPGYTFTGWSLQDDGTPDYAPLTDIYTCDFYENILIANNKNDAKITLYACWKAEQSTLYVDVNTNNIYGNAAYGMPTVYGTNTPVFTNTIHQGRTVGSDNKAYDNAGYFSNNILIIDRSNIVTPKGYGAVFFVNGSPISTIYETTMITGYTKETISDNAQANLGVYKDNVIASYDTNGYLTQLQYIYNKAPITERITFN